MLVFSSTLLKFMNMSTENNMLHLLCQTILGYITLWREHFDAVRFVVAFFGIAHFGADLFDANFTKIIFLFCFLF